MRLRSAAAALRLANGSIEEARIALGGVAPKPWRIREAEEALRGARADSASFHHAAAKALAPSPPATTRSRSSFRGGS
jgi:xanthine dehydrogenase YagS FAD-binding subunit